LVTDPLVDLAGIPEIADHCEAIQGALDAARWDRTLIRAPEIFWNLMRRESGYASAELDGARPPDDPVSEPDDSPMGRLCQASLLITADADAQFRTFMHSPMQVWARMHALADDGPERGRPRDHDNVSDPLHLGVLPPATEVTSRMLAMAQAIVNSRAPAVLVAAIAHAELAVLRPFANASYLIARATPRMVLRARDADPLGAASLEVGQREVGRVRYVQALRNYASGSASELVDYLATYRLWTVTGIERTIAAVSALNAGK
jgi:hypothetical protein